MYEGFTWVILRPALDKCWILFGNIHHDNWLYVTSQSANSQHAVNLLFCDRFEFFTNFAQWGFFIPSGKYLLQSTVWQPKNDWLKRLLFETMVHGSIGGIFIEYCDITMQQVHFWSLSVWKSCTWFYRENCSRTLWHHNAAGPLLVPVSLKQLYMVL